MILNETEIYTADEAQQIMKISYATFRRLVKKGDLCAVKIGGQYRIMGRQILELLNPTLPRRVKGIYRK